jgi:hypothetical protein
MAKAADDVTFRFPVPPPGETDRFNRTARAHAQAKVIEKSAAQAARAGTRLVLDLTNFDLAYTTDLPLEAMARADTKLAGRLVLANVSAGLRKALKGRVPDHLLAKPRPNTKPAPAAKAKPAPKAKVAKVTALWVVPGRAEDDALLAFLKRHGVRTPKPALALDGQRFETDADMVWHSFTKEVPVCVATATKGKPALTLHRAEPESGMDESGEPYDDHGGKYNQWDFIRPTVEAKPILVQKNAVYVGFNALLGEVIVGTRRLE